MKHNTSIFLSLAQKGQMFKTQSGIKHSPAQVEKNTTKFREMMRDVMQVENMGSTLVDKKKYAGKLSVLKSKITELSAKTKRLLEKSDPEISGEILSQAVIQLRKLVVNFDAQNGTHYVAELSKNLTQVMQNSGMEANLFVGVKTQPANLVAAQTLVSEMGPPIGAAKNASLAFVQTAPPAEDASLFAPVTQLFSKSKFLAQNVKISPNHKQAHARVSIAASVELQSKGTSAWQQHIQKFAVKTPLQTQTLDETVAGQVSKKSAHAINKTGIGPITFVAGGDAKAKVKDSLLKSTQAIVSGADASGLADESGNLLLQMKAELQSTNAAGHLEQARPTKTFSLNIANQIQGKTLNEGITRIELLPRGLGNIVIELQTKKTGDIHVLLKAENLAVLNALRTDRAALLSALSNSDVGTENIELNFEGFSQGQFNHNDDGLNSGQNTFQLEASNEPVEDTDNISSGTLGQSGSGQLDILT